MKALLRDNTAVTDINWVLDYFRRTADHRLLFGGRVSYSGLDPLNTQRATRARMLHVFPQLADVGIDYSWGGYVDITMNRAPDFGRLAAERLLPAGLLGPRHRAHRHGGQAGRRGHRRPGRALRHVRQARTPRFPGRAGAAPPALVLAML